MMRWVALVALMVACFAVGCPVRDEVDGER